MKLPLLAASGPSGDHLGAAVVSGATSYGEPSALWRRALRQFRERLVGGQQRSERVSSFRQPVQHGPDRERVRPQNRIVQLVPLDRGRDGRTGRRTRTVRRDERLVDGVLGVV